MKRAESMSLFTFPQAYASQEDAEQADLYEKEIVGAGYARAGVKIGHLQQKKIVVHGAVELGDDEQYGWNQAEEEGWTRKSSPARWAEPPEET